jgi:hypothetical protein
LIANKGRRKKKNPYWSYNLSLYTAYSMPYEFQPKEEVVLGASNHLYHIVTLFSSSEPSPPASPAAEILQGY